MKSFKRQLQAGFFIGLAATSASCTSYDKPGPLWSGRAPVPEDGYGIVCLYRPTQAWGAGEIYIVEQGDRVLVLYAGAYGVLVAPTGPFTYTANGKPVNVTIERDEPTYMRVEFDSLVNSWNPAEGAIWEVAKVDEATALKELADTGLAAGGRGRYMDGEAASPPAASATAEPTERAEPTSDAPDPFGDTVYLKDGTILKGNIVDEADDAISIMFKDGHGQAVPRSNIERIARGK